METGKSAWRVLPWFALVILAAVFLRLYNLGTESLWIDEGNSLRDAQVVTIARQSKPLYYWILSAWLPFVHNEAGMRLPSVVFSIAGSVLLYFIGRDLFSKRTGLIAAFLMAISPLHITHSQEVRMYTLIVLLALISTYLLLLQTRRWTLLKTIAYIVSSYLMLLTHPLTVFLLVVHGAYLLFFLREQRSLAFKGIATLVVVALLWVPWIPNVMQFGDHFMRTQGWASESEKLSPAHIPLLWGQFMYGEWNRLSYADKLFIRYAHYAYAGIITLAVIGAWAAGRRRREIWLVGMWALLPLALMITLSMVLDRSWPPRYLIYTSPAIFILLAYPLSKMPSKTALVLMALLVALPAARLALYYRNTMHPEWRQAVSYVESHAGPSDIIYIYKPSNRFVFAYYYDGKAHWKALGRPDRDGGWNSFIVNEPVEIVVNVRPYRRSWLMLSRVDSSVGESVQQELQKKHGRRFIYHGFHDIDLIEINPQTGSGG